MIPYNAITAHGVSHPWPTREQIEQDLLLDQAICEIYQDEFLGTELAFRGGTASVYSALPYCFSSSFANSLASPSSAF